jgi:hypothetical protein
LTAYYGKALPLALLCGILFSIVKKMTIFRGRRFSVTFKLFIL